jgi:hypothetical protein
MKKIVPLLGLVSAILSACSGPEPSNPDATKLITSNDFESLDGWIPAAPALTRDQAHSGKYSTKVDANNEFSVSYFSTLGRMSPSRLHKVKVQAWVYLASSKSQARLGMQIVDPNTGKEVFGDGINLANQVKSYKKWVEIEKEFTLPENISADQVMKLFLWRDSAGDTAYLDDVKLSIAD